MIIPCKKNKTFINKTLDKLHLHKQTHQEKLLKAIMHLIFYLAIFVAGYLSAKLEILIK